ncbi:YbaB/EbfC family nucleoid-associated protein [Helicobacter sp. MIT 05-5293]|uniref:YbaB/EbfC family nucleoid-associated protein n=1 Tax=Helicobacter sp. MIT 05-5293 TaxID=1548149 RepID=UPI00051DF082|nr:YbaB/EbfC family nucleoid-associated protein [Helicobacter sp. MIT 05-5293]TLD82000.1 YbaB/EbfC family nucleoid-associated protein [Helicobacter sp. MIT 05-5293]
MFDPKQFGEMLNNMQDTFKNMENQNKQTTLTAKSGGGLVSVSCNGNGELIDISIDDSLLEDKESLQILLMSAINDLYKNLEQNRQSTALSMLGNLNLFGGSNNA